MAPLLAVALVLAALVVLGAVSLVLRHRRPSTEVPEAPEAPEALSIEAPAITTPPPVAVEPPAAAPVPPKLRAAVFTEAVPAPATISGAAEPPRIARPVLVIPPPVRDADVALDTLDVLLAELESTTVRIDGADALDEGSVAELEGLAARLEAAAESLTPR